MSFGPAFDAKEQIRQAVDIVELVGGYVQLRRQGRNFVGICPWHDDSRPSLQVNQERQSFKCWVCDIGGDVFSFMMKAENLEFREALELLAERAGIQLQSFHQHSSEPGGPPPRPESDKRTLYRVTAWAEAEFHRCLIATPEGEPGRQYLADRGISPECAKRFHLGFAPQRWDWLLERSRGNEWSPEMLERVGLLRRKEGGGHYDWFRGRVMFSIRDARSRPIAFGGRVLPQLADERSAKYINSPEMPLFSKSRELYALEVARDHFQEPGGAIVMEGYTDVLMAHQHGIHNCVAVLGTALGERHLQLLHRHNADQITLVLDGDAAGRRRTNEILDALLALFEKKEVNLQILTLPEGIDPCDFIATHGSDSFRALIAQAVDPLEHKFRTVTHGLNTLTDTHRASQAAEQMLATLAQIRPVGGSASSHAMLREEQMLSRVARKFHLPEDKLRSRLNSIRQEARIRPRATRAQEETNRRTNRVRLADLSAWERDVLELLLINPTFVARICGSVGEQDFSNDAAREIFTACCRLSDAGWENDFGRILAEFDDPDMKNLLVELDESCATKTNADRERWLADLLEAHRRRDEEKGHRSRLAAAREDAGEAEQLLAQFCEQSKSKHLSDYERRKK